MQSLAAGRCQGVEGSDLAPIYTPGEQVQGGGAVLLQGHLCLD